MTDDPETSAIALAREADSRREELAHARRIPADLFRRAGEAMLFRQMLAKHLGGLGHAPADWFRAGVAMARWEPSFAWVVTQGAGDVATYVAAGDDAFAAALLRDPGAYIASSDNGIGLLERTPAGLRVAGRWGFCSGCQGATWVGGYARFAPDRAGAESPPGRFVLMPASRVRVEEDWDTMGMIGTGSHSIVVEPQEVPESWTFVIERPGPIDRGPMSIAAGNGYWPIATAVAAVQLGIARRALDEAQTLAMRKTIARSAELLCRNAWVQRRIMRSEAAWLAAKAAVEQVLEAVWKAAEGSPALPSELLVALISANIHASLTAIEIVEAVCEVVSSSVAPARSIFGACLRDARTMGSHIAVNPAKLELAAKIKLGLVEAGEPL
ncbi:MAG: acyl-CoA dehydrogenase family protein [Dongiaceae bacterium]